MIRARKIQELKSGIALLLRIERDMGETINLSVCTASTSHERKGNLGHRNAILVKGFSHTFSVYYYLLYSVHIITEETSIVAGD
jgi:hypothetical protein